MSITTRGNTCTGCHRIGSLNTCGTRVIPTFGEQPAKMLQSIGRAPHGRMGARPGSSSEEPAVVTDFGKTYPRSAWMPIGNDLTEEEWNVVYERDVAELERCCADPEAPGCIVEPVAKGQAPLAAGSAHE